MRLLANVSRLPRKLREEGPSCIHNRHGGLIICPTPSKKILSMKMHPAHALNGLERLLHSKCEQVCWNIRSHITASPQGKDWGTVLSGLQSAQSTLPLLVGSGHGRAW